MASNRTKRNIYLAIVIAGILGIIAILIIESCGIDVNNWFFYFSATALIVGGMFYNNFRQAVKEDEKYGKK
ncbi:MAG: hypothetical protein J6C44_03250 [Muribaculaceae bacterium]|nr:hypothetical protein [Muribaculaceae bacterium]